VLSIEPAVVISRRRGYPAAAVVNLPGLGGSALIAETDTPFFSVCEFGDK
jgi:hypothetical protein